MARSVIGFKLSGRTSHALDKNDTLVSRYLVARENHFKILVLQFVQMIGFKVLVTAGLLLIGGLLVLNQEMNIGQFVAAELIILLVITSVEKLILGLESFYDVLTSLEKLGQVVDKELEPQSGQQPFTAGEDFSLELDHIDYEVPGGTKKILENIAFTIGSNSKILIQGSSGSGKSTLLRLIAGIIEPSAGNIYVNNISLKGVYLKEYRSYLGQSLTDESPFEGTLEDNITFGDPTISTKDIYWALEKTGLTQFVKEQEQGLKTVLYPEGKQIPYTISKKIVMARSIITRPKLLLLKDPLDQFDESEATEIMNFLTDSSNGWALLVVSKNPKWKHGCNTIITLEKGKIINKKK